MIHADACSVNAQQIRKHLPDTPASTSAIKSDYMDPNVDDDEELQLYGAQEEDSEEEVRLFIQSDS